MCRRRGLEGKRRCGWQKQDEASGPAVIWARGRTAIATCPTSYISSESMALLEEFHAWKLLGAQGFYELPARLVEAISILENELRAESNHGQQ